MEQVVEFDRDKLEAAMKAGLNLNDCDQEDLEELLLKKEEEVDKFIEEDEATMNLSAIGGDYKIGPLNLKSAIGNMVLLNVINSPFITGELSVGDEIGLEDVAKAIYVLAKGRDAVEPIMEISQRISDLCILKSVVVENPELMDKLLDRAEEISMARSKFCGRAIDFYNKTFVGIDFQEVVDAMLVTLIDIGKSIDNFPSVEEERVVDNGKKKDLTTTGH